MSTRIPTLADTIRLRMATIENSELKEHARKSMAKLDVAMRCLKQIRDASHKSGRAKRLASAAIRFIEAL